MSSFDLYDFHKSLVGDPLIIARTFISLLTKLAYLPTRQCSKSTKKNNCGSVFCSPFLSSAVFCSMRVIILSNTRSFALRSNFLSWSNVLFFDEASFSLNYLFELITHTFKSGQSSRRTDWGLENFASQLLWHSRFCRKNETFHLLSRQLLLYSSLKR